MFEDDSRFNAGRRLAFQNLPLTAMEVHSDRKARYSGQFFVEIECREKPSGIAISEAKCWAIELHDNAWAIIPTARLRDVVAQQKARRGTVRGGDDGAALGVLVPLGALFLEPRKPVARNDGQMNLSGENHAG
jgi:hypothetical protein